MATKKEQFRKHVIDMINDSYENMVKKADNILDSGVINFEEWDERQGYAPLVLPKAVISAVLQSEVHAYSAVGTTHERKIKKTISEFLYHIY